MLELGGLLTAGSILLVSILGPIFRRASPPRWTNVPLVPELTTVGITGLLAFGLGLSGLDVRNPSLIDLPGDKASPRWRCHG